MTARDDNLTPGEMLAAARKKAGLSLEQLAEDTKIPPNMLRAVEMDEYHKVSGDLSVKSFLRAYAKEVGLEPEDIIEFYHVFTGAAVKAQQDAESGAWDESDVEIKRVGLPWGLILTALTVVAMGVGAFFWFSGGKSSDAPLEQEPVVNLETVQDEPSKTLPDTIALGWHMSEPIEIATPPPGTGKPHLPLAFAGTPEVVFQDGKTWPYVVRLISEKPGQFEVMKDAEMNFQTADFPASLAEAKPLPLENVVAGRAYAVKRGFVVYWGAEDHLSLRLGHIRGVELSFNTKIQDLTRFHPGQEILLDQSLLIDSSGN